MHCLSRLSKTDSPEGFFTHCCVFFFPFFYYYDSPAAILDARWRTKWHLCLLLPLPVRSFTKCHRHLPMTPLFISRKLPPSLAEPYLAGKRRCNGTSQSRLLMTRLTQTITLTHDSPNPNLNPRGTRVNDNACQVTSTREPSKQCCNEHDERTPYL